MREAWPRIISGFVLPLHHAISAFLLTFLHTYRAAQRHISIDLLIRDRPQVRANAASPEDDALSAGGPREASDAAWRRREQRVTRALAAFLDEARMVSGQKGKMRAAMTACVEKLLEVTAAHGPRMAETWLDEV
jgi:hypothetical protein